TINDKKAEPGNVYKREKNKECRKFFTELKQGKNSFRKYFPVQLEISPICDHAQNKWKCHRLLNGIAWPFEHKKSLKKAEYLYQTPPLYIDNTVYILVFDFRRFYSQSLSELKNIECAFKLKKSLLVDIQSHFSGHANRPGITCLNNK
ncbi:MAG: hypothetical protein V1718_06055, partial [archaeon]